MLKGRPPKSVFERFAETIEEPFDVHNDCWIWKAAKRGGGYGRIKVAGKNGKTGGKNGVAVCAHRLSYELFVGPIPENHAVHHICRNRACVRPDHLQAITHRQNQSEWNLGKTHCINGHPYSGGNLQIKPSGERRCRICHNAQEHKRQLRKRGLKP